VLHRGDREQQDRIGTGQRRVGDGHRSRLA
jgi:hypothetical protein